jgi:hypothetical protein
MKNRKSPIYHIAIVVSSVIFGLYIISFTTKISVIVLPSPNPYPIFTTILILTSLLIIPINVILQYYGFACNRESSRRTIILKVSLVGGVVAILSLTPFYLFYVFQVIFQLISYALYLWPSNSENIMGLDDVESLP